MKKKEIKTLKEGDLLAKVAEIREKLRIHRFGSSGSKEKNVKMARTDRRTIARLLTEKRVREMTQ